MPRKKITTEPAAAEGVVADAAPAGGAAATPNKTERLIALLSRPEGATLDEMMAATSWQAHSVRGAMAGTLRKKGLAVASAKTDGVRRYRIAGEDEAR